MLMQHQQHPRPTTTGPSCSLSPSPPRHRTEPRSSQFRNCQNCKIPSFETASFPRVTSHLPLAVGRNPRISGPPCLSTRLRCAPSPLPSPASSSANTGDQRSRIVNCDYLCCRSRGGCGSASPLPKTGTCLLNLESMKKAIMKINRFLQ